MIDLLFLFCLAFLTHVVKSQNVYPGTFVRLHTLLEVGYCSRANKKGSIRYKYKNRVHVNSNLPDHLYLDLKSLLRNFLWHHVHQVAVYLLPHPYLNPNLDALPHNQTLLSRHVIFPKSPNLKEQVPHHVQLLVLLV